LLKRRAAPIDKEEAMNELSTSQALAAPPQRTNWKAVYTIVERGQKSYWIRIGTAFINHDSSWNVKLDAVPVNGTLQIRDPEPFNPARRAGGAADPFAGTEASS
jgi:hypothetical protein